MEVNILVYNADPSELLQPQDSDIMETTESYGNPHISTWVKR